MKLIVAFVILLFPVLGRAQGVVVAPTIDLSGTVTTGGTFYQGTSQTKSRRSIEFNNICQVASQCVGTTDVCYIYFGVTASATKTDAIPVPAGWSYLRSSGTIPGDAIQIACDGSGDHYRLAVQ